MDMAMLWRKLDGPGHDACRFTSDAQGCSLVGCAVFVVSRRVCQLRYTVIADAAFRTRRAEVTGFFGRTPVALQIRASVRQRWTLDGVDQPALEGCIDLDLAFTPATNLLPIRRLGLNVGEEAQAPAAYLAFPRLELRVLPQRYQRLSRAEYAYESPSFGYRGTLRVSPAGAVLDYPDLFQAEDVR